MLLAHLAESREIELDVYGIAGWGNDTNDCGIGDEGLWLEIEGKSGAGENAAALFGATVDRIGRGIEWFNYAIFVENLEIKILPKGVRTIEVAVRSGIGEVHVRELHDDAHGFALIAVVDFGLLGAIDALLAAALRDKSEGR